MLYVLKAMACYVKAMSLNGGWSQAIITNLRDKLAQVRYRLIARYRVFELGIEDNGD